MLLPSMMQLPLLLSAASESRPHENTTWCWKASTASAIDLYLAPTLAHELNLAFPAEGSAYSEAADAEIWRIERGGQLNQIAPREINQLEPIKILETS